jgi:hypothetical protein
MNTQTTVITEADVASFLKQQAAARGISPELFFTATLNSRQQVDFSIYGHVKVESLFEWVNASGPTIDEAVRAFEEKIPTPATKAAAKRAEAAKLLAEAAILEGGAA